MFAAAALLAADIAEVVVGAEAVAAGVEMAEIGVTEATALLEGSAEALASTPATAVTARSAAGSTLVRGLGPLAAGAVNPARAALGAVNQQFVRTIAFTGLEDLGETWATNAAASRPWAALMGSGRVGQYVAGGALATIEAAPMSGVTAAEYAAGVHVWNLLHSHQRGPGGEIVPNVPGHQPSPTTTGGRLGDDTHHKILIALHQSRRNMQASFPKTVRRKLKWSATTNMTYPGTVGTHAIPIKMNCLKDPGALMNANTTSSTIDMHEPLGYSQYAAIYDQCIVHGATVRVDYYNTHISGDGTIQDDPVIIGLALKDDASNIAAVGHYEEIDHSLWRPAGPEHAGTLTMNVDAVKFFGIPKKQSLSDPSIRWKTNTIAADKPTNELFLHIWSHGMYGASVASTYLLFTITVEYDVTFMEPKAVGQSAVTHT